MKYFLFCWVVILSASPAFPQVISSAVYPWHQPPVSEKTGDQEQILLEGTTRDFSHFVVQAITVPANQPGQPTQQFDEEAILIARTGELTLTLGGKRNVLGPGSVAVIMPGDEYGVENKANQPLSYYLLRYTSNEMPDLDLYRLLGESFWVNWPEMAFAGDQSAGRRQMFACGTVMSRHLAMQITTPDSGLSVPTPHTHRAAELIFTLEHSVQVQIEGVLTEMQVGDLTFVESEVPHRVSSSKREGITYLSIQF